MGKRNFAPARVYKAATQLIEAQLAANTKKSFKSQKPVWYDVIGSIPPGEILTRTQPVQHREISLHKRVRKPSKLFAPQEIFYEEDKLRKGFYGDHPWELARPRIILEQDGKDGQRCDWSRIQQPGRQLDGESVVQRQLWLLHHVPGMTSAKAYDQARHEFYEIRHQEDVERRVAREEALSTGAYFGKTILEVGMELEDKSYEAWKEWATKEIQIIDQQRSAAYTGIEDIEGPAAEIVDDDAVATIA